MCATDPPTGADGSDEEASFCASFDCGSSGQVHPRHTTVLFCVVISAVSELLSGCGAPAAALWSASNSDIVTQ